MVDAVVDGGTDFDDLQNRIDVGLDDHSCLEHLCDVVDLLEARVCLDDADLL